MVFTSNVFMFLFLPVTIIAYFLMPTMKLKNVMLLLVSLFFYAWGEPIYVLLLIFSSISDYLHGKLIYRNKIKGKMVASKVFLISSLIINLGVLSFFKYADFLIFNINSIAGTSIELLELPLPIGISFFTFQTMSYSIDIYRGKIKAENNFITMAMYVAMFPQLIAGPIVRYSEIESEVNVRTHTVLKFSTGIELFILGFAKKLILANTAGMIYDSIWAGNIGSVSFVGAWFGIIMYAFHIYFDFSGYSDMAVGLSNMFGFTTYPKNFNYPYMSKSISEFWRRWHMTLGNFFRDYLYIPLGGNKVSTVKWIRNVFVVWFLTGLWHGSSWNFVIWGLYFGVILVFEKYFYAKIFSNKTILARIYTIFLILIGWAIFDGGLVENIISRLSILLSMGYLTGDSVDFINRYDWGYIVQNFIFFFIAILFSTNIPLEKYKKLKSNNIKTLLLLTLLIVSIIFMTSTTFNPFIYFRF